METTLKEAMASGVFVEFHDASGNTVGQAVYCDWRRRPVPSVGDSICCRLNAPAVDGRSKLTGQVCSRRFEVQFDDAGEPCVWVHLIATLAPRPAPRLSSESPDYSAN